MNPNWPFADPPNVATFTVRSIVEKRRPILLVVHDDDDGGWQFLDGNEVNMCNAMLIGLGEIAKLDQSILELANLPLGWYARRQSLSDSWLRGEKDW